MDIMSVIRGMLPSFGKSDVEEKLRLAVSKMAKVVRPILEAFAETIDEMHYKSAYGKQFMKEFIQFLPSNMRQGNAPYVTILTKVLGNAERLADQLETYVSKNMGSGVHIEGITYQKASVLRLIELLDFFAEYTTRHLSFLVAAETNIEAFERPDGNPYTPGELKWLQNNLGSYLTFLEVLANDPKLTLKQIADIPEVVVSDVDVSEIPALANGMADPLHLGAIPVVSYCFRWVGIRKVNYDIERYERCLKDKQSIELRLETLRQRRAGNIDAQNEVAIDGYENELVLIRAKIAALEERQQ